jgi:hypothetical protein
VKNITSGAVNGIESQNARGVFAGNQDILRTADILKERKKTSAERIGNNQKTLLQKDFLERK